MTSSPRRAPAASFALERSAPAYDFKAPFCMAESSGDRLFPAVIATRAFRRLRSIRFLGGIDYLRAPAPNGRLGARRYTRHQHSLGVARLALGYCDLRDIQGAERRLVGLAALLHDLGHAPLSHSLEPVFRAEFGLDHHRATEAVILGRVALGREIHALLRGASIDLDRLLALIGGRDAAFDGFFDGPINFDTIEGILRTRTYATPAPHVADPDTVMIAAARRRDEADRATVDEFWRYKDLVYRFIVNTPGGVLADAACQAFMRRNLAAFSAADFYTTEETLFRKLPGLRRLLASPAFEHEVGAALGGPVAFKARRFSIDPDGDFFARDDARRYRQSRAEGQIHPMGAKDGPLLSRDLFDDDADD